MYTENNESNEKEQAEVTEVLEPIHRTLKELLDMERKGLSEDIVYTDIDITAVTLLYAHVMGNRLVDKLTEEKAGIGLASELGKHFAATIAETTMGMTGVDTSKYHRKRSKK